MKLSAHFTLSEASKSQTALRLGIDNTPPDNLIPVLSLVARRVLEPVRAHFGKPISPTSWYRCPVLNKAIGSSERSQHCKGEAVDFEIPSIANIDVAKWITANLEFDQLILEFYRANDPTSGWVHCSYKASGNRGQVLRFDGRSYRPGLFDQHMGDI